MSHLFDLRSGEIIKSKLVNNGLLLKNVLVKQPLMTADFVAGTYKASGQTKTFEDLFTFNRVGKAWLVKDTGLQEYEADVPRLDNGLLIEQSATNLLTDSVLKTASAFPVRGGDYTVTADNLLKMGDMYTLIATPTRAYLYKSISLASNDYYGSLYVSKDSNSTDIKLGGISSNFDAVLVGILPTTSKAATSKIVIAHAGVRKSANIGLVRYAENLVRSGNVRIHGMQVEQGSKMSSLILTNSAPVTRPADYLLNKITGTTVTGDWDSTLTLSIVNGQLVHSGYGRIRSLEIT